MSETGFPAPGSLPGFGGGGHWRPNGAEPAVEVVELTTGYGGDVVLRDVSFAVARSEIFSSSAVRGAGKAPCCATSSG